MHKYKLGELGSLKRALKARDGEIGALQGRLENEQRCTGLVFIEHHPPSLSL
jgi:hypothetical protein